MERANGKDQFYSRMTAGGKIELFVDRHGSPTISYPHVHVVHHGGGTVDVVASRSKGDHSWHRKLHNPSGNDVNRAIDTARRHL